MSLVAIWVWGMAIAAVVLAGLIGLLRRPVPYRHVNYALVAAVLWPLVLIALLGAALLIVAGVISELVRPDDDGFWEVREAPDGRG